MRVDRQVDLLVMGSATVKHEIVTHYGPDCGGEWIPITLLVLMFTCPFWISFLYWVFN